MTARRTWFACTLFLLAPALAGLAAEKDLYGDPLPEGAKVRLGTARLRSTSYGTALLSPDGKTLYLAGPGGWRLLDPATGAGTGKLPEQPAGTPIGFSADGKRGIQNQFEALAVWDTVSGKTVTKLPGRIYAGDSGAALSADGKVLVIGGYADRTKKLPPKVTVWDVDANKEVASIASPQNDSAQVALAPDGKTLAVWGGHYDPNAKPEDQENGPGRHVYFFDAAGKELSKFRGTAYAPHAIAIGPNGLAAVSAGNNTVDLVDPKTGASKFQLLGRSRMGRFVTFSPDGSVVAATGEDGATQLWRASDGSRVATTESPLPGLSGARVRMLDNEKGIAWAVRNLATFVWEVPSGKPLGPTEGHTAAVSSITVTADGKYVLTSADASGSLRWELATGKLLGEVPFKHPNAPGYAPAVVFSADGARALSRESFTSVGVFDVATGAQWYTIPIPDYTNAREVLSPDGSKVILTQTPADSNKASQVRVIDAVTGKRLGALELSGYSQLAAAVTPDGKYLITAGSKPVPKGPETFVTTGWELATGTKKGELTTKSQYYRPQVVAAPDNRTAAVATGDGKVIAFDFLEGKEVRTYKLPGRGHNGQMVLSPDGKRLAVACQPAFNKDATTTPVVIFDWASGDALQTITAPGYTPQTMAFTPDGKKLLTSAADTTTLVWEVSK